jgi:hypothetical protein
MAGAIAIEDMRSVDPIAYIRAVGLQPEDSYGFLPMDLEDVSPHMWLYRDRPEYEQRRVKLPGPDFVQQFGPVEIGPPVRETEIPPGGPDEPESARIERIGKLKEIGAINAAEYERLVAEAAPAPEDAPQIVAHRLYPGIRMRSSTRQLNRFLPRYRDALRLCPEDVYGVYPASTRISSTDAGSSTEWDDFWIVYRDRGEYAQGREQWAKEMDKKARWPEPIMAPGVSEPGAAAFDGADVSVEKDRWPREKVVMRRKGTDLAEALREKIGKWGYGPEDSFGFCPNFGNGSIYFGWRKR